MKINFLLKFKSTLFVVLICLSWQASTAAVGVAHKYQRIDIGNCQPNQRERPHNHLPHLTSLTSRKTSCSYKSASQSSSVSSRYEDGDFQSLARPIKKRIQRWRTAIRQELDYQLMLYPELARELNNDFRLIHHFKAMVERPYYLAGLIRYRKTVEGGEALPLNFSKVMDGMVLGGRPVKNMLSDAALNKAFDQEMLETISKAWESGVRGIQNAQLSHRLKQELIQLYKEGYTSLLPKAKLKYRKNRRGAMFDLLFFKTDKEGKVIVSDVVGYEFLIHQTMPLTTAQEAVKIQMETDEYDRLCPLFTIDGKEQDYRISQLGLRIGQGVVLKRFKRVTTEVNDDRVILESVELAENQVALGSLRRSVVARLGFADKLKSLVSKEGLTLKSYFALQEKHTLELTQSEYDMLNNIRNGVDLINKQTLLTKVISKSDMEKYLTGRYIDIGGWFTTAKDSKHLLTTKDLFYGIRLDTRFNDFSLNDASYGVIRFKAKNVKNVEIPRISAKYHNKLCEWPYSGYGITSGVMGRVGVPEWKMQGKFDLEDGAELWEVNVDGHERLRAVYLKRFGRFVEVPLP